MELKEKLEKANKNIAELISALIYCKQEEMNGNCAHPNKQHTCSGDCRQCKHEYFIDLQKELINKYSV